MVWRGEVNLFLSEKRGGKATLIHLLIRLFWTLEIMHSQPFDNMIGKSEAQRTIKQGEHPHLSTMMNHFA